MIKCDWPDPSDETLPQARVEFPAHRGVGLPLLPADHPLDVFAKYVERMVGKEEREADAAVRRELDARLG